MKAFILLLLFIGMFMIVNGVYEEKLKAVQAKKQIEYRFVPRTYYDEQLQAQEGQVMNTMDDMFSKASPWFDAAVGAGLDKLRSS